MTDAQWERLGPMLPPQRPRTGRPARDHRTILSAILWVLRTGAPWRDLPERFGPWSTAWSRFRRWTAAGIWAQVLEALLDGGRVRRPSRGRPRGRPRRLVGDRGYSYPTVRRLLARRHISAIIPRRSNQRPEDKRHRPLDRRAYRERNRIERLVNRLKQYRRVATRYEKRAAHDLAMVSLAAILLWAT